MYEASSGPGKTNGDRFCFGGSGKIFIKPVKLQLRFPRMSIHKIIKGKGYFRQGEEDHSGKCEWFHTAGVKGRWKGGNVQG